MADGVKSSPIPPNSMLYNYTFIEGGYVDCYFRDVHEKISLDRYINMFFDSWLFRIERRILSTAGVVDSDRKSLEAFARGDTGHFSAWHVLDRSKDEVILSAADGIVRTWLFITIIPGNDNQKRLYFGSALVPKYKNKQGEATLPLIFRWSLPFHRLYSRMLLSLAVGRLVPADIEH